MPDVYDRMDRAVRARRDGRLRARFARLPAWLRIALCGAALALGLPWLLRAYVWYWDAAWGRPGALLETILPKLP